jgi:lactoylglutathione lyase
MSDISLNLVVLRTPDVKRAVEFYTNLGLTFVQHRHGKGPEHFSAGLAGAVFEIYPQTPDTPSTLGTRIGFHVPSIDATLAGLSDYPGAVLSPAKNSEWGWRAVVADPDGHRIELTQSTSAAKPQDYTVILGAIGQTVIYEDPAGPMIFTFRAGKKGDKSICLEHYDSGEPLPVRYDTAFQRTKQYLESLGYKVEVSEKM